MLMRLTLILRGLLIAIFKNQKKNKDSTLPLAGLVQVYNPNLQQAV
jgi:hypothetical protein